MIHLKRFGTKRQFNFMKIIATIKHDIDFKVGHVCLNPVLCDQLCPVDKSLPVKKSQSQFAPSNLKPNFKIIFSKAARNV